ncbi:MAG: metallophosphoesterase [Clostridia bacterium]|nr:metallophosphoesterase [Clostridia bacterium]
MARRERNQYIFYEDPKRHRGKGVGRAVLILLFVLLLACGIFGTVLSGNISYVRLPFTIPNLPADMEGFAILHVSDLHGANDANLLAKFQKYIKNRTWSCMIMTGDMIGKNEEIEGVLALCALFPPDMPKYLILGDEDPDYLIPYPHENLTPFPDWMNTLLENGVTLVDEPILITRGKKEEARLWLVPEELYHVDLDTMQWAYEGQLKQYEKLENLTPAQEAQKRVVTYQAERMARIREKLGQIQDTDLQFALTHVPITEEEAKATIQSAGNGQLQYRKISMILAGHYCGGQWVIPGIGPIYIPEIGWFPKEERVSGMSYPGGIPQYTSPGLGASGFYSYQPGRFMNPECITSIELTSQMRAN